jgi:hypothetical protein
VIKKLMLSAGSWAKAGLPATKSATQLQVRIVRDFIATPSTRFVSRAVIYPEWIQAQIVADQPGFTARNCASRSVQDAAGT